MTPTTENSAAAPTRLGRWHLGAYSTLQLPLAMAALPIVANVSHYYGKSILGGVPGIFLILGVIFFLTRLLDAVQDPLIGFLSDRMTHRRNGRLKMAMASVPVLALGFYAVFSPPQLDHHATLVYLLFALILVHLGYSGVSINYHSLGAELSYDYYQRTRVTVWREVFGIVGLLLGAALRPFLVEHFGQTDGHLRLAMIFLPLVLVPAALIWIFRPHPVTPPVPRKPFSIHEVFVIPFRNKRFRSLLLVYLVNGTSVAIGVSVVLFFIEDIIAAPGNYKVWFILAYFASGIGSVPFWLWLSRRTSKSATWLTGIAFSAVGMLMAVFLGHGDIGPYFFICIFAGFGLGSDYGLPPSILADVIHNEVSESQGESGKYFGLWAMATKLTTAIGGGAALMLLDGFSYLFYGYSYEPGITESPIALVLVYAALPAAVKLVALVLLWRIRVEAAKPSVRKQWRAFRRTWGKAASERT